MEEITEQLREAKNYPLCDNCSKPIGEEYYTRIKEYKVKNERDRWGSRIVYYPLFCSLYCLADFWLKDFRIKKTEDLLNKKIDNIFKK